MNIAIFASAFHPSLGGVEELVRQLAHELIRRDNKVIVLTNRWPRSLSREESFEGIPVYRLPFRTPEPMFKARISFALTHRCIRQKMLAILQKHSIEILHVQCVSSNAMYVFEAKRALNLPLVVTLQGELTMDATQLYQRSELARKTLREALDSSDAITVCSGKTLADAEEFYGKPFGDKARVVFNGVNVEEFTEASPYTHKRPYLFAIGRLVPQKGFDVLLRAFAQAGLDSHDLLIAGEGPEKESLEKLSRKSGLGERVQFLGRVVHDKVPALFKGCDFFVLPSREEPFGIVNVEAMAAGKAVVAARVGGVPEILVHGENGLLVEKEDVKGLAKAITSLCCDRFERERLGENSYQRAQGFSWTAIASQYLAAYEEVRCEDREKAVVLEAG